MILLLAALFWCQSGAQDIVLTDVARHAGLTAKTVFGGEKTKRYIIETTGGGAAFFDYDHDGWLDIFLVNGSQLDARPNATNHLYRNRCDGTFEDVTARAGLARSGWGQGVCAGDFDNDGYTDLFVTVSDSSGVSKAEGHYGLGVLVSDFDNDGFPDVYVANDKTPSLLFRNRRDGTFEESAIFSGVAFDPDGRVTSYMGAAAGDFDRDGWLDILKTNFSGESASLYHNRRESFFLDEAAAYGVGKNLNWVGWGCGFADFDNDGWPDSFIVNGHVFPNFLSRHMVTHPGCGFSQHTGGSN